MGKKMGWLEKEASFCKMSSNEATVLWIPRKREQHSRVSKYKFQLICVKNDTAAKDVLLKLKQPTCVCVFVCVVTFPPSRCICAVLLSHSGLLKEKSEFNCSRLFHRFSRQIISGLCPLAPTLCPSRPPWPIIICHSFDLFIRSTLGWVEAKRNPLISGS